MGTRSPLSRRTSYVELGGTGLVKNLTLIKPPASGNASRSGSRGLASSSWTLRLVGCRIREGSFRYDAATSKLLATWVLMYSGDSLSRSKAVFLARTPVLSIKDFEVVESKRDLDWYEEIYSVRRKKETPESENFGFPKEDSGRRSARSCGWGTGRFNGAWIATDNSWVLAQARFDVQLTTLISIKNSWHSHQVQWHSKLCIGLDIERLISSKAWCETRVCVLSTGKAGVRDVQELGRVWRRRKGVRVSYSCNIILMDHALTTSRCWRGHVVLWDVARRWSLYFVNFFKVLSKPTDLARMRLKLCPWRGIPAASLIKRRMKGEI